MISNGPLEPREKVDVTTTNPETYCFPYCNSSIDHNSAKMGTCKVVGVVPQSMVREMRNGGGSKKV